MKKASIIITVALCALVAGGGCATNPYTGQSTMAFVSNDELFAQSFTEYKQFLAEQTVITGTADAALVTEVGERLRVAAEKWVAAEGRPQYLDQYEWEYRLVDSPEVNAWCMPGGKIVVYTGILPVTKNADGLAVVLGHELSHALLNHGQQRQSASILQSIGGVGVDAAGAALGASGTRRELVELGYGAGSSLLGTLPFSRKHESEADAAGLTLMTIAGYRPEEAAAFWERMAAAGGGGTPEFLSTHPSDQTRINALKRETPTARETAARVNAAQ